MSTNHSTIQNHTQNPENPDWDKHIKNWQETDKFIVTKDSVEKNGPEAEKARLAREVQEVKEQNKPIKLKACGKHHKEVTIDEFSKEIGDGFNERLVFSKKHMEEHKEEIQKQINSMVALYNIGDQKAFFFITPQEARLAIDFVKEHREGKLQAKRHKEQIDQLVEDGLQQIGTEMFPNVTPADAIHVDEKQEDLRETITLHIKEKNKRLKIYNYYCYGSESLTLSDLNRMFAIAESLDLTVQAVIMDAMHFSTVRGWGKTVYDELTRKDIEERKKDKSSVVGEIWNSDIYRYNELARNQIVLYSETINAFFNFFVVPPPENK